MICSRQEMLACIKKTIQQASAEEKRQLREALLRNWAVRECPTFAGRQCR
jgi:hypothetical protein